MTPVINRKTLILWVLYLVVFLNYFGYSLIMPVLSNMLVRPDHGLLSSSVIDRFGDYIYSIVLAGGSLSCLIFSPIIGRISDWLGRRYTLIGCILLMIISFIIPIAALTLGSLGLFLLGNTLNGISSNSQPVSQAAITDISERAPKNLAYRFCIDIAVITAAMMLGPSVGELLSDKALFPYANPTLPFYLAGALSVILLVCIAGLLPETNIHRLKIQTAHRLSFLSIKVFSDIRLLPPSILRLLLVGFLVQTAWGQYFQYLFIYMPRTFHFDELHLTGFTLLNGGSTIVGLIGLFPLLHRFLSLRKIVAYSMGFCACSTLGMALIHHAWAQWLLIPVLAIFVGIYFPALLTLLSTETAPQDRGWVLALSSAVVGLAWLITGFTAVYFSTFNPHLPILISSLLLFLAWILMPTQNHI